MGRQVRPCPDAVPVRAAGTSWNMLELTHLQPMCLVSLDGRSAYDSVSRAAVLSKLREVVPELLLCACSTGALPRTAGGTPQAVAGTFPRARAASKGTPSPPLFALGQHDASQQAVRAPSRRHSRRFLGRPLRGHDAVPGAVDATVLTVVHPGQDPGHRCPSKPRSAWDRGTGR